MDDVWKSGLWGNVPVFTMAGYSFRLWQASVLAKHAVAIFSPTAAKHDGLQELKTTSAFKCD